MPQTQRSGIEYTISCKGSGANPTERKERWVPGAQQVTEVVRVAWGDWQQFLIDMLGNASWEPNGTGGFQLARNLPETHPIYDWMICTNVEFLEAPAAVGADGREMQAFGDFDSDTEVVAAVTFESVLYQLTDDATAHNVAFGEISRYVERPFRFATENLTLTGAVLEWRDNAGTIDSKPAVVYPSTDRMYIWRRVPAQNNLFPTLLYNNILATMGRINSGTFDSQEAYTLLCGAPEIQQEVGPTGDMEFTIKYPMSQLPIRSPAAQQWNSKYRVTNPGGGDPNTNFYDVQIRGTGGQRPYGQVDFGKLFLNA